MKLKVMTWNIQFMAGKNYVFFYDRLDNKGPDSRPSANDIRETLSEVCRVIADESPDVLLLQELDDGAKRTDYQDQLDLLLGKLRGLGIEYPHHTSAFYWKSKFVPHPKIMGAVGLKLGIISRYPIANSTVHPLPLPPKKTYRQDILPKKSGARS